MGVGYAPAEPQTITDRVRQTVALVRRRGYALPPAKLGPLCLGGAVTESEIRACAAACPDLKLEAGLLVERDAAATAAAISERAAGHDNDAPAYLALTLRFVRTLVAAAPFIRSVAIAGSLASGGFRASDDVDLNLIVDDGHRHLAYVAVNVLGIAHALRHRAKPVDDLTRRPVAPRLMTANLILERSDCFPLERQDEDMAFELLTAQPVFGHEAMREVVDANPRLLEHFPQLSTRSSGLAVSAARRRLPASLYPRALDGAARLVGESAWRYMQWTRRHRPEALARVAYVRSTMRPYTLFDR